MLRWVLPWMGMGLAGCGVNPDEPATPGSPASTQLDAVETIAMDADALADVAAELTALVDESRRRVRDGKASPAEEIARMRVLMAQLEEMDIALQQKVVALEAEVRRTTATANPAP